LRLTGFDTPKVTGSFWSGMVSVLAIVGLLVVVAVHTVVAALLTRFFRVRLSTRWGPILYALTLIPLVLLGSTLLLSGLLNLGPNLGGPVTALFVMILVPLSLGITIDYVWMPAPDEVELPETI
jgi:hypothetical protein